jgi:hypothetical protein
MISEMFILYKKNRFLSNVVHKLVYIPVSEYFSFSKIIHPPDRCGITRSWLKSMSITQVHLVLGTIKMHSKMCRFVTKHNATDVSSINRACNWHAVCRNVHTSCWQRILCNFSTISHLQRHFREFGSTSIWHHNRRPSVTTPAQDLHIWLLHLQDLLTPATRTAGEEYFCL